MDQKIAQKTHEFSPLELELLQVCRDALLCLTRPTVEAQMSVTQQLMRVLADAQVLSGDPQLFSINSKKACFWCS